jgi:ATP-dependent DNA helicase PIF1
MMYRITSTVPYEITKGLNSVSKLVCVKLINYVIKNISHNIQMKSRQAASNISKWLTPNTSSAGDPSTKQIVMPITENPESHAAIEEEELNVNELSTEQRIAYLRFIKGGNIFITGPGGTGKTRLIKYLVQFAKSMKKKIQVCALTGCAAILLGCNARTLHSWSGIKLAKDTKDKVVESVLLNKHQVATWKKTDCLILDEVSMLSRKIFEIIDEIARRARRSSAPFGGMQVIFTGDFYQLPPVGTHGETDSDAFCFESPIWNMVFRRENHIELKTIFRQADPTYINILKEVREGRISEAGIQTLHARAKCIYNAEDHGECVPTKLFPLRAKTDYVNATMFARLVEEEHVFSIIRKTDCMVRMATGKELTSVEMSGCHRLTAKEREYELSMLTVNSPCVPTLRLKKGAVVMCSINLDVPNGICNGSQGIISGFVKTSQNELLPMVRFSNGITKTIYLHYWQSEDYPMIAVGQFPLCLAWALTIHKIQGASLDIAEIDIGQSIFEYGQTYVALSRVRSLDGLYLSAFQPEKICANPKVSTFYQNMISDHNPVSLEEIDAEMASNASYLVEEPKEEIKVIRL